MSLYKRFLMRWSLNLNQAREARSAVRSEFLFLTNSVHAFRAQSKDIADKVCRLEESKSAFQMIVPTKDRCGVKNPDAIHVNEKCTCSQMNDEGVGKHNL